MLKLSKSITPAVAIIAIAFLTWYALSQGMNGAFLTLAFTIIGGLVGYKVAKP